MTALRLSVTSSQVPLVAGAIAASEAIGFAIGRGLPALYLAVGGALVALALVSAAFGAEREPLLLLLGATTLLPSAALSTAAFWLALLSFLLSGLLLWRAAAARQVHAAFWVYLLLGVSMVLSNIANHLWVDVLRVTAWFALSFALGLALYTTLRARGSLLGAVAIGALASVSAIVVLVQAGVAGQGLTTRGYVYEKNLIAGTFGDVNGRAYLIMIGIPVLVSLTVGLRGSARLIALAGGLASFAALFSLLSRSALLGAVAGSIACVVLLVRLSPRWTAAVVGLGLAGYYLVHSLIALLLADERNVDSRRYIWSAAVDLWKTAPLLGHGTESWPTLVAENARMVPPGGAGGAHNVYLQTLFSTGAIGFVIQLLLFAGLVVLGARVALSGDRHAPLSQAVAAGATGALVAQLTRGLFEASGWAGVRLFDLRSWYMLVGWMLVAVLLVAASECTSRGSKAGFP